MREGGVAEDVVIAQGEQKDPDKPILPDLVVGDGVWTMRRVRDGGRQDGMAEDPVVIVLMDTGSAMGQD